MKAKVEIISGTLKAKQRKHYAIITYRKWEVFTPWYPSRASCRRAVTLFLERNKLTEVKG